MENVPEQVVPDPSAAFTPPRRSIKKRIPLKILFVFTVVSLILVVTVAVRIGGKVEEVQTADVTFKKNTEPVKISDNPDLTWKNYRDETLKFTLDYPELATIEMPAEDSQSPYVFRIVYTGANQKTPIEDEFTITDGYIFKVIVTTGISTANLDSIAVGKKAAYETACPEIYTASPVKGLEVNTVPARYFTVTNCPGDYSDIFVHFNSSVYEIVSVHRGDLGYRQQYQAITKGILDSFRFLDKPIVKVEDPLSVKYYSQTYRFSFEHPLYDIKCCDVQGPVAGSFQRLDVLAQPDSQVDNNRRRFNGFGLYVRRVPAGETYEDFLNDQRRTLEDDYKIIKGVANPDKSEEKVMVGDQEGTMLKGYAWWGDVVYVNVTEVRGTRYILAISKTEVSPGSYDGDFRSILSTFRFNVAANEL